MSLRKKIRILGNLDSLIESERRGIENLANEALSLAAEISELVGDHQTPPPTLYPHDDLGRKWQTDMYNIRTALIRKFMQKHATKSLSILTLASRYLPISERDIQWSFAHISSDHQITEIRGILVKTGIELQERLKIPVEYTLPHLPAFYEDQRELPLQEVFGDKTRHIDSKK